MKETVAVFALLGSVLLLSGCGHIISRQEPTPTATRPPTEVAVMRRTTPTPKPATPMPTPTFTPSPTPIIHRVQRGDTLLGIANQYGVTVESLQEVNGILDPRLLQLGQELIVPQGDATRTGAPPTATPTPVAYAIENVGFYEAAVGSLWFLGEVHNTTSQTIEQVRIRVTLQGEEGEELGYSSAFAVLDFIVPGGRSPFAVLFSNPPDYFARYEVIALAGVASTHLGRWYRDVAVTSYWGQPQGATLAISGEVENVGPHDAEAITVVVTGYDSSNRVVAVRASDLPLGRLRPGESAPFRLNLLSADAPIVSYTVQVQAYRVEPVE